ncbi:MAG: DNA polymerase III subunit delta [Gemmatimonadota bacterium]
MTLAAEAELAKILETGQLAGSFFLFGDAVRLRDEAAARLLQAAVDPATRDFNLNRFRGGEVEPETLAATLAMPPLMADLRVVGLSEAERLSPTGRKVVLATVENPPADLSLVISGTVPKGSSAAFYRTLKRRCRTLEWRTPPAAALPGWLMERARSRYKLEMPAESAQALASAVGADLSRLDTELAKLASAGDGALTLDRVRDLVPETRRPNRWEWLDLVASRAYRPALTQLDSLLAGERGVGLLASMVDQHLLIGVGVEGGLSEVKRALAAAGKGNLSWKASAFATQARKWTTGELERAMRLMYRADRQLKSGGGDREVLQELLLVLAALPARRA